MFAIRHEASVRRGIRRESWSVFERSTGYVIAWGATRSEAMAIAFLE